MLWNVLGIDFWLQDKEIGLKHNILVENSFPNGDWTCDASLTTSSKQNALNSVTRGRQNLLKSKRELKWNCASWNTSQPISRIVHNTLIRAATYEKGKTQGLLHWFFKSTFSSYAFTLQRDSVVDLQVTLHIMDYFVPRLCIVIFHPEIFILKISWSSMRLNSAVRAERF